MSGFRTYSVILHFINGGQDEVEVTVPAKPYWSGQLEREIKQTWNANNRGGYEVSSVKVFRNYREGGIMVDTIHGRVIEV